MGFLSTEDILRVEREIEDEREAVNFSHSEFRNGVCRDERQTDLNMSCVVVRGHDKYDMEFRSKSGGRRMRCGSAHTTVCDKIRISLDG